MKGSPMSFKNFYGFPLILILAFSLVGCQIQPQEKQLYVSLMIDGEREDAQNLINIINELQRRKLKATVYATADYANKNAQVFQELSTAGFEIGFHGYYSGEQLATMTRDEQKDLLTRGREAIEGCVDCGDFKAVNGFKPQYYSMNEDTLSVLDELGLEYVADILPGKSPFENYAETNAPFKIEGHSLYAVPITTMEYNGTTIHLCDIACAMAYNMTPDQWLDSLTTAMEQAIENKTPLVVNFHGWYSGDKTQYNYWQAFVKFLDAAVKKAEFVTNSELVKQYKGQ
jgi:peptidoglycan/xylan/chitin deacetylase (PgdA/CDA1 family)